MTGGPGADSQVLPAATFIQHYSNPDRRLELAACNTVMSSFDFSANSTSCGVPLSNEHEGMLRGLQGNAGHNSMGGPCKLLKLCPGASGLSQECQQPCEHCPSKSMTVMAEGGTVLVYLPNTATDVRMQVDALSDKLEGDHGDGPGKCVVRQTWESLLMSKTIQLMRGETRCDAVS